MKLRHLIAAAALAATPAIAASPITTTVAEAPAHPACNSSRAGGSFAISCGGSYIRFAAKASIRVCTTSSNCYYTTAYGKYVYQYGTSGGCMTANDVCSWRPGWLWTRCPTGRTCTAISVTHVNESPHPGYGFTSARPATAQNCQSSHNSNAAAAVCWYGDSDDAVAVQVGVSNSCTKTDYVRRGTVVHVRTTSTWARSSSCERVIWAGYLRYNCWFPC